MVFIAGPDFDLYDSITVLESIALDKPNMTFKSHQTKKKHQIRAKTIEKNSIQIGIYDPELAAFLGTDR